MKDTNHLMFCFLFFSLCISPFWPRKWQKSPWMSFNEHTFNFAKCKKQPVVKRFCRKISALKAVLDWRTTTCSEKAFWNTIQIIYSSLDICQCRHWCHFICLEADSGKQTVAFSSFLSPVGSRQMKASTWWRSWPAWPKSRWLTLQSSRKYLIKFFISVIAEFGQKKNIIEHHRTSKVSEALL